MILELINPSDKITFVGNDPKVAGVAVLLLGEGAYGLTDVDGKIIVPLMLFGSVGRWFQENSIENISLFIEETRAEIAEFLETVVYGSIAEREAFDAAISRMTPEKAAEYREWWNDRQRSSMNDIGKGSLKLAAHLRKKGPLADHPSSPPIIIGRPT